jgi:hypothetical protein
MREFKQGRLSTEFWLSLAAGLFGAGLILAGYQLAQGLAWERVVAGVATQLCGTAIIIASSSAYARARGAVKSAASSPTPIQGRGAV